MKSQYKEKTIILFLTKLLVDIALHFERGLLSFTDNSIGFHDKSFCSRSLSFSIGIFRLVRDHPLGVSELGRRLQKT